MWKEMTHALLINFPVLSLLAVSHPISTSTPTNTQNMWAWPELNIWGGGGGGGGGGISNRMTASILKQDPYTKRFQWMLIYFDMDTQYANFPGNPLCQSLTKGISLEICIKGISLKNCILCVPVKINTCSFEPFCVWLSSGRLKNLNSFPACLWYSSLPRIVSKTG